MGLVRQAAPFIEALTRQLGPISGPVKLIRESSTVSDGNAIYEIGDLIVLVSPAAFPKVAAVEASQIKLVKRTLPNHLSSMLLDIAAEGVTDDGRSYIALPKGTPISSNKFKRSWQKRTIKPAIFKWLRGVAMEAGNPSPETSADFRRSLESLGSFEDMPEEIRSEARYGIDRIDSNQFIPKACPMHSDLWQGNIIFAPNGALKIIDWRGSRMKGCGIFDLVKFCQSFGVGPHHFRVEVLEHCAALNVEPVDAWMTFLAACGYISRNLDEMPRERFVDMTISLSKYYRKTFELAG